MLGPEKLEEIFHTFAGDLGRFTRDGGIIEVDLTLLSELGLLDKLDDDEGDFQAQFPFYFHVIETAEKVTLFNHQFVVWIVPKACEVGSSTLVLVALMVQDQPHLEIAFSTSGVYNSPKYVLKVLRHYLGEVMETEEEIASIRVAPPEGHGAS